MIRLYMYARLQLAGAAIRFREILGDERGATVAEYALVLVLVAVALITVLTDLRVALEAKIDSIITQIEKVTP